MNYRHTQIGWFVLATSFVVLPIAMVARDGSRAASLALALGVAIMAIFGTLTVAVDERRISWRFGIGLIRKSVPIRSIVAFRSVRNPWYYGWGIRFTPRGWLYNVSGLSAIELDLQDGRHVLIGTDEPEALENALRQVVVPSASRESVLGRPPSKRAVVLLILGINAVVIPVVLWTFYAGSRAPVVRMSPAAFSVSGGFSSADVPFSSVQELSLQDEIPRVLRKRNGFNAGDTLRGDFALDVLGNGKIFINRGIPPYIVVKTTDSYVIINFKDPQQTRDLFQTLQRQIPQK